jgi:hypothetical protein
MDGLDERERERDLWPDSPSGREELLADLDRTERHRLARVESDPVRRELIVDRAMDRLLRRLSEGDPPSHPRGWLRVVVNDFFFSNKIRRDRGVRSGSMDDMPAPECSQVAGGEIHLFRDWLFDHLVDFELKERDRAILIAVLTHRRPADAARSVRMDPSNFRRDSTKLFARLSARIRDQLGRNPRILDRLPPSNGMVASASLLCGEPSNNRHSGPTEGRPRMDR